MMTTLLSVLLVAAAALFVAWPFLRTRTGAEAAAVESLSPLERQKVEAYAAIKEAEFDLRMGKLSEADFAELETKYRQQALAAIAGIEEARQRAGRGAKSRRPTRMAFCPACGQRVLPPANFCAACGQALRDTAA